MQYIKDALASKRLSHDDFSVSVLKSGPRSLTDCAMIQLSMKKHLLGQWLDAKPYPHYVKDRARKIFESWTTWRALWHPYDDAPP
eukprot:97042-Karenia_brevis.AAC.1